MLLCSSGEDECGNASRMKEKIAAKRGRNKGAESGAVTEPV